MTLVINLDDLTPVECSEVIDFVCDDAGLVEVGSESETLVLAYNWDKRTLTPAPKTPTLRLVRQWDTRATRERIAFRWALLLALVALVVFIGFVFGLGLLSLGNMLQLATLMPTSSVVWWNRGSVDNFGLCHPLTEKEADEWDEAVWQRSQPKPLRPYGVWCTCWSCHENNGHCDVYQVV